MFTTFAHCFLSRVGALFSIALLVAPAMAARLELVAGGGVKDGDCPPTECRLREPFGVEFAPGGEMVIVEMTGGNRVLRQGKDGLLRVIAGTGAKGYSGDGGPAVAAMFNGIHNLAITPEGDIWLSDSFNHAVRKIGAKTGVVSTVAGSGSKGFAGDGGSAASAQFSTAIQIALDGRRLLIADIGNRRVRALDLASGKVSTVAGNGQRGVPADGQLAVAQPLADPRAAIGDGQGGFYILERDGHAIRHVTADGAIRTVAGNGTKGHASGPRAETLAAFNGPKHFCLDRDGTLVVADAENHLIRRFDPKTGSLSTIAGTGRRGAGAPGLEPLSTELNRPHGVTIAPDGALLITDTYNDRVLRLVK